ncbi:bifunctional diaminohydroxyphosphoribosylaminopyrimidine deaminase/5-amino-6-(5-phosphoribosylamino)uracil reductase RibD [Thermosulfuriphilus ammonigenes]|uniref:Riboflavin biosynthesis protein RibD n=1 Tax=Thermosulfuriphilus ammonigenes TaxID=1936021 RepID=A0A6G7PTH1_9BACT|nr:bifunctional diaminohydroxyphosphoribosylaminopyrimidine deaminase/5-amino-6-(5-phosphoribosylamino)uracil reductase RibD [Thermosulfuriphilus ammonigenes]MBA2848933.1 diaminohydroxyphosphoribosylaminopyrimidine deaminase/5-amino-6-(5-phosphoribosylamino)uracil reductase [Thermosulfuriphilus ammonigenes]QIJ70952.1 bifunctional diaminohydroxyphosphoribosylaminopyrimidine deaminase/5-amino-6-(5-phosphoribosylamino)uracil reductase RibD [Thermosulfuriphilus ammonigenes]
MDEDIYFMKKALSLGRRGLGRTSPNPPVGAVVVKEGRIIGRGYHPQAGKPHAEVYALAQAGEAARGATIYITLEPCNHHGRTPPCTQAILRAGIARVVVALRDPNPQAAGGLEFLRSHGLEVKSGVLAEEALELTRFFIKAVTEGRPWVLAKAAMSLDGRIATYRGDSKWITDEKARQDGHRLRKTLDAIAVGVGTVLADNPRLTCRLPRGRDPHRVIFDTHLRTPPSARILAADSPARVFIICGPEALAVKEKALRDRGAEVIRVPLRAGRPDLLQALTELKDRGILSLLLEGGATLHGAFFDAGLVDEIAFYYGPVVIGGSQAPAAVAGQGAGSLGEAFWLSRISTRRIGKSLLVRGYIRSLKDWLRDLEGRNKNIFSL